ncbi:MAG: BPTD_3080 family restriction endonuclease [Thermoleophilia bacterium]
MPQVVIENPILNSPFEEPRRHFRFGEDGITDEITEARRVSSYFVPIPAAKKKGKQLLLDTQWTQDRIQENEFINQVRGSVARWRQGGRVGVTRTTRLLLDHWGNPERERRLFFCQLEALETVIYLAEVAPKTGDAWIENKLRDDSRGHNPDLYRIALKMATGSGKTVVMAMIIAWQTLNKLANPQDARFSDAFLVVTPGITIRDRLRVLLPNDPATYHRALDLVPADLLGDLHKAKIVITNFHAFQQRERVAVGRLTKSLLTRGSEQSPFTETPEQMVRRVCRELGNKRNLVVINDEAHHCYRRRLDGEEGAGGGAAAAGGAAGGVKLTGDDLQESKQREEEARIWISGLEAVKRKLGVRVVYDLSATPFFLRGSGYSEGTLFPWVVSDFSLIDAIESGIVKVPRVPVADDAMTGGQPTYRDLWMRIRDELPKKGRKTEAVTGEPKLPVELEGALYSLYSNYEKHYALWQTAAGSVAAGSIATGSAAAGNGAPNDHLRLTPPVFIMVCNNTNVSKLVFDWVAGWEKPLAGDQTALVQGKLRLFSNVEQGALGAQWSARPSTILVDSRQLESGEAMSADFKKIAAREIEEFKAEYRERFPGRDTADLTDEDLLREVMNTVGKSGKLGEQIKCVVSVSMLTEGWDANTVTHILGVRAFSTQLLCEQVVGRGLRRVSYVPNTEGRFDPEYAEVYGVPFSFIPCSGSQAQPKPVVVPTRVRALEERIAGEITFPRLLGYRYELPSGPLTATFTAASRLALSTADVPTKTENAPIVGQTSIHTLDDLKTKRLQEIAFLLSKLTVEKYFRQDGEHATDRPAHHQFEAEVQGWRFPEVLSIARRWLDECVTCKDNTFPQLLLLTELAHDAADRIYQGIVEADPGPERLKPVLQPYDTEGSTRWVDFDTTRPVYATDPAKCHLSHVVADTESWEQKMAQTLEDMPEVEAYVKNHNLGFFIPYTINGEERRYIPDFLVRLRMGEGSGAADGDSTGGDAADGGAADGGATLNLILEVSGEARKDKAAKVAAARSLWVPAVNNHGGFGRWAFLEISDPWDAQGAIRAAAGRV